MIIANKSRVLVSLLIALIVFVTQKRFGMTIIAFLLVNLLLSEELAVNLKTMLFIIFSVIFFVIGRKLSYYAVSEYVKPIGIFAFTFAGGFIGGIIELETYLCLTLLPMQYILHKDMISSLKYTLKLD